MRVKPIFAWFDLWVGVFVDKPKRRVYVFPVPCLGLVIELAPARSVLDRWGRGGIRVEDGSEG